MIGMNSDTDDDVSNIVKQLGEHKVNWRQGIMREESALHKDYDVSSFPTKVFIGKDGNVKFIDIFITKEQLEKLIKAG